MCDICGRAASFHPAPPAGLPALSRRAFATAAAASAALVLSGGGRALAKGPPPKPENVLSPADALNRLMAGNRRYVAGTMYRHDLHRQRDVLASGQNPFAAVLSCADSRIAPEYAFDTSRGDLFVCRLAGNFASDEIVASLEYAVAVLRTPFILVLGHERCGAVDSTIKALKDNTMPAGHIPSLVNALAPAVKAVSARTGDKGGDILEDAIRQNVIDTVARLKALAPILSAAVSERKIEIAGGIYKLKTGRVELLG